MSRVVSLLRSSRPEIATCTEHRDDLWRRIQTRSTEGGIAGFLSRRPEFAVLVLSGSVAIVLWVLSLTAAPVSPLPRSFSGMGMESTTLTVRRISTSGQFGIVSYATMLLPQRQTADIGALQQALAGAMRDRQAAQRIAEDR